MAIKPKDKRRYYLHQKIKKLFKYSASKKQVFINWDQEVQNRYLIELKEKYNYSIQTEIY